jgi:hypothetical protein
MCYEPDTHCQPSTKKEALNRQSYPRGEHIVDLQPLRLYYPFNEIKLIDLRNACRYIRTNRVEMAGSGGSGLLASMSSAGHAAGLSSVDQNMIIEKLKELQQLLVKCEEERVRNEQNMQSIVKTNDRMQNEPQKLYYKQKLKTLYKVSSVRHGIAINRS